MTQRIISASLSPNTEKNDVIAAIAMLLQPWKWKHGTYSARIIWWFKARYPDFTVQAVNSGRSALYLILQSFGIQKGDRVFVQSFTCVAVANAVLWTGATPVYVDIDTSLNLDVTDAEKKYSKKIKAIIVQHTLGLCANMEKIIAFAKKHNILVIEDCAHALGAKWKGNKLGSLADAAFFSFGRDKVLSSVFGGVSIIRSSHISACKSMEKLVSELKQPSFFWIFQQLLHPILFSILLPFYTIGIGKALLWIFQKLQLLSVPIYPEEKYARRPRIFPSAYANALAYLLLLQLSKLERYNAQRIRIAQYYIQELKNRKDIVLFEYPSGSIFLRFPISVAAPKNTIQKAKKCAIVLGNWYHNIIDPQGVDFSIINYTKGSCPKAETIATSIVNLPTNISEPDAKRVVAVL